MCKGISFVLSEQEVYWSEKNNSHEEIKIQHKIKDTKIDRILIAEMYPRGKSIFSRERKDWEIKFENTPGWFIQTREEERIHDYLINHVFTAWESTGKIIALLDLSGLNYETLPANLGNWATKVDCSYNQLTELNLPLAAEVDCYYNQMTELTLPLA